MQPFKSQTWQLPWTRIAERVPGRNEKQCRERWMNHLHPSLNDDPWTTAEDDTLCVEQAKLGNKWAEIAEKLPGRSSNDVKNRVNTVDFKERVRMLT